MLILQHKTVFPLHRLVSISLGTLKTYWHILTWSPDKCDFTGGTKQWNKSSVPGFKAQSTRNFRALRLFQQTVVYCLSIILHGVCAYCFKKYFTSPQFRTFSFLNYHNHHDIKWRVKNRKSDLSPHLMQINHPPYFKQSILFSLSCFHTQKHSCRIWIVSIIADCPNPNHILSDSVSTEHNSNTILV